MTLQHEETSSELERESTSGGAKPTRRSLPLSARDLRDLAVLRGSAVRRDALAHLADTTISATSSEAQLLHAVLEAGMKAVEERIEEAGYAELAKQQEVPSREARARRRRPSWADEQ